jgi:hypothetical protein
MTQETRFGKDFKQQAVEKLSNKTFRLEQIQVVGAQTAYHDSYG